LTTDLQSHPSIPQNRAKILSYMTDTFDSRQEMIETELTSFPKIIEKCILQ